MKKQDLASGAVALAVFVFAALVPSVGWSATCPGAYGNGMALTASFNGTDSMVYKSTFISAGCSTVKVGGANAPTACNYNNNPSFPMFFGWSGMWATAPSTGSAGCSFMCPGGSCFVRYSDGLPVELLQFGVE